jgi:predicted nucleic acid-binding Zn ribbon protein
LDKCPQCGGVVRKLFSAPAVQFKGTGWYVTDYGNKSKRPGSSKSSSGGDRETKSSSGDSSSGDSSSGDSSSGGKKADAKSSGSKE